MRRLDYNVYSNINQKEYFEIEDKLVKIESAMSKVLRNDGWRLSGIVRDIDGLAIDFILKEGEFYGNICLSFDDLPKQNTFTFVVTKSFDEKHTRYFIKAEIFKNKAFEYLENDLKDLAERAIAQYKSWSRYEIIYKGAVIKLDD